MFGSYTKARRQQKLRFKSGVSGVCQKRTHHPPGRHRQFPRGPGRVYGKAPAKVARLALYIRRARTCPVSRQARHSGFNLALCQKLKLNKKSHPFMYSVAGFVAFLEIGHKRNPARWIWRRFGPTHQFNLQLAEALVTDLPGRWVRPCGHRRGGRQVRQIVGLLGFEPLPSRLCTPPAQFALYSTVYFPSGIDTSRSVDLR